MPSRHAYDPLTEARHVMQPFLDTLITKPDVQALCILSSSARIPSNPPRFDEHSDFDVSLILDLPMAASEWRPRRRDTYRLIADRVPAWLPNFLFHVPVPWGSMEVNVHQLIFQYESDPRTLWDSQTCDTYLNKCELVFDRDGLFQQLIEQNALSSRSQLTVDHLRLANRITWDIREIPLRQARRLGPQTGHYILNIAIDEVVDYIYASRGQFIPNKKWKLAHLVDRSHITPSQVAILAEALRCDPSSVTDLERRISALERFCRYADDVPLSGPGTIATRMDFHRGIQLQATTLADTVSGRMATHIADTVRDVVNYSLCGSSVELVEALTSDSLSRLWSAVVPQMRDSLTGRSDVASIISGA